MNIIEYNEKYDEQIKDLLVELQQYIVAIDKDDLSTITDDYREKYFAYTKSQTYSQNGKIFLAEDSGKIIGMIAGHMREYFDIDKTDYKCPTMGVIEELIVSKNSRSCGAGKTLMKKMEEYFKSQNCTHILLGVFGYNDKAYEFYKKQGYHTRMIEMLKKLD